MKCFTALLFVPVVLHAQSAPVPLLFRDVRVFDGAHATDHRDVLIREGRIAQIAAHVNALSSEPVSCQAASLHLGPGLAVVGAMPESPRRKGAIVTYGYHSPGGI
jgi:hypothetical protein